jgi:hypothetical protein
MSAPHVKAARARDRALRVVRTAGWAVGLASAGLTAGLSVVAAQAFKGHDGKTKVTTAPAPVRRLVRPEHVSVPPPQRVPAISGAPAPITPPAQPPAATPPVDQSAPAPVPAPAPQQAAPPAAVSGGS